MAGAVLRWSPVEWRLMISSCGRAEWCITVLFAAPLADLSLAVFGGDAWVLVPGSAVRGRLLEPVVTDDFAATDFVLPMGFAVPERGSTVAED